MKPGRPKSHIKGKWVTWKDNNQIKFYELDQKENLVRINNQIQAHHIIDINTTKNQDIKDKNESNQVVLKPKISEIDNFVKDSSSITAKPTPVVMPDTESSLLEYNFDFSSVINGDNEVEDFPFFDANSDQDELWWK